MKQYSLHIKIKFSEQSEKVMQEILEDFIADVDELIGPSASDAVQDPKLFYRIHMSHNDGNPNQPSTSDLNRMYNATKYITRRRGKS